MTHFPVQSLHIASVAHDGSTLEIKFTSGVTYAYRNVPANVFDDLRSAKSVGGHFHRHINRRYPQTRVLPTRKQP